MPIIDGTGGFKAWRVSLLQKISLSEVQSQGYSFQIEMNFRSWRLGAKIKEESIIFFDRTVGHSKNVKKYCLRSYLHGLEATWPSFSVDIGLINFVSKL